MGRAFSQEMGLGQYELEFATGAQVAQDPLAFESVSLLDEEDRRVLRREVVSLQFLLYGRRVFTPRVYNRSLTSSIPPYVDSQVGSPKDSLFPRHLLFHVCCSSRNG